MKKRKRKILLWLCCAAAFAIGGAVLCLSHAPFAARAKRVARMVITRVSLPPLVHEKKGLGEIVRRQEVRRGERVYITKDRKRIINHAEGYYFDIPLDFELKKSHPYMQAEGNGAQITVSREWAYGDDVEEYISHYLNRFVLSPQFQEANNITVTNHDKTVKYELISAIINDIDTAPQAGYTYVFFQTKSKSFYRIMFRYDLSDARTGALIQDTVESFRYFSPRGAALPYETDFYPRLPENWSEETAELYRRICDSQSVSFGIFTQDIYGEGIGQTVPKLEKRLGYAFPVILSYLHFGHAFPMEFMQKNYENQKIVELTYQTTTSNNEELFGYTPFLDIYRGKKDGEIRRFARAAKAFGHPFLFRLNNESNSDWTSYSGVVGMSDPDIYVAVWQRFYHIFQEEGVDNAIWVFNPNDRSYPPCSWNDFTAFYPGNGYVHMIGVTGYNNGTYYPYESWREFSRIYDEISEAYLPVFGAFPWMITEFASSSVGGSKPVWIRRMFDALPRYPNIKIAVWFSYADYDASAQEEQTVARPYWLDETEQTTEEFRKGLERLPPSPLQR